MLTIEPRPASRIAEPNTWVALKRAREVDVERAPEVVERDVLDRVRRSRRASGGWSMPALLTRIDGDGGADRSRTRVERRAVGDVARPRAGIAPGAVRAVARRRSRRPRAGVGERRDPDGPSLPSAPVTTATRPRGRARSAVMPRRPLGATAPSGAAPPAARSERGVAPRAAARSVRPSDALELVRRQAVAGDLSATSASASTWPAGRSRAATSFLPIFVERPDLARIHAS